MKKLSDRQRILRYMLRGGRVSGLNCIKLFHTTEHRKRISELRQDGFIISDEWHTKDGSRFKVYFIEEKLRLGYRIHLLEACKNLG